MNTCRAFLLLCVSLAVCARADHLPGTKPAQIPANVYDRQFKQTEALFLKRIEESPRVRDEKWRRDFASAEKYAASVKSNRATVAKLIGVGERAAPDLAAFPTIALYDDVRVDGILLLPKGDGPFPVVIACHSDAESPEKIVGTTLAQDLLSGGVAVYAPRFVPRVKDHPDCGTYSKDLRYLVHRFSYSLGKHPIGVDVDTVCAATDALPAEKIDRSRVGVLGIGQGGITAMYAAALDERIKAAVLIDSFDDRSRVYDEPADRAIFRHLVEFDDSDVCSLIAPRPLCIVGSKAEGEFAAVQNVYHALAPEQGDNLLQRASREQAVEWLARMLGGARTAYTPGPVIPEHKKATHNNIYAQLKDHFRKQIEASAAVRTKRWASDEKSPHQWTAATKSLRNTYLDLVGRWDHMKRVPLNPRSQKAYDTEEYVGYKILLDVFDGLEAFGVLLVPKDIAPGERRPVVICQHGFAGNPEKTIGPGDVDQYYHRFPHNLARRGYVVFVPYIVVPTEESEYRLDRLSKVLGESRVSVCTHQYRAIVDFLQTLPFANPDRIGFQGLSYGGFTGLWVVSQEPRISPVVVAGYFSDWKARLFDDPKGYMPIRSECMYVWGILHTFNHSDLAAMICPRPIMIEHGIEHGPNWITWSTREYKPVEALYARLGIPERQSFYAFPGGHETGTEEAFRFLDRWLQFKPKRAPTGVVYEAAAR